MSDKILGRYKNCSHPGERSGGSCANNSRVINGNENDVLMTSRYFSYNSANENKQAEATAILEIEANQERNEEPLKLRTKFFTRRTARRSFTRICSTRWERGISLRSGLCLLFSVSVRSASWAVDLNSRQCKNDEKPSKNIQGLSLGAVAWHTI